MPIDQQISGLLVSSNAPELYPVNLFFGMLCYNLEEEAGIPKLYPIAGEWGAPLTTVCLNKEHHSVPAYLDLIYLSIVEQQFYSIEQRLSAKAFEKVFSVIDANGPVFEFYVVGMAPYGGVALWAYGSRKASLLAWMHAEATQVDMKDFMPDNPDVTLEENCGFYIDSNPEVRANIEQNGMPPLNLYDKYMQQFSYRYQVIFGKWNDGEGKWEEYEEDDVVPVLDSLEEALFDGTHDKLNDGGLMKYHEAGKPKKLALNWHIDKKQFSAYYWFHDEEIKAVFDRFYGPHPETKADFIIRIDPDSNKYLLTMFRYGLQEPLELPEDSYEMIVFRNNFEAFRSDNYSQSSGAWIW